MLLLNVRLESPVTSSIVASLSSEVTVQEPDLVTSCYQRYGNCHTFTLWWSVTTNYQGYCYDWTYL